jgi:hypothetical protein
MKVYNQKTGKFYICFSARDYEPVWTSRGKVSQAGEMSLEIAEAVVRQLQKINPGLLLQVVE